MDVKKQDVNTALSSKKNPFDGFFLRPRSCWLTALDERMGLILTVLD